MLSLSDLALISGVSEKRIRKIANKIPGYMFSDGEYSFIPGTRIPFDLHRYKLNNTGKRYIALLDATYNNRYIDYISLKMERAAFDSMVDDLLHAGYLIDNGSNNQFGANRYNTTIKYEEMKSLKLNQRINIIVSTIASFSGSILGTVIK